MDLDFRLDGHQKSPPDNEHEERQRIGSVSKNVTSIDIQDFLEGG